MNRSAVAAPAEEPTDDCNWLPLKALTSNPHDLSFLCRRPCVQHFDMKVAGSMIRTHRCEQHKLANGFIEKLRRGVNQ